MNIWVGRGTQQIIATYFIVSDFVHFSPYLPSPADLCAQLAHINQVPATTGKFGSNVPHYQAGFSFEPGSYSSWADCFTSWITKIFDQDTAVNGQWLAYEAAFKDMICKTIPRLLLPLQANGREIIPVLVHGNLSTNHLGIRLADGMPVLFNPCAAYAHQEFELGVSQLAIGGLDKTYVDEYLRMALPSEPVDEVYHRIILYGVHFNLRLSASHTGPFRERYVRSTVTVIHHNN